MSPEERFVIGILGMPDNEATQRLVASLTRESGLRIDFVVYWQPSSRYQWRRFVRKLRRDGPAAALGRIVFAVRARLGSRAERTGESVAHRVHYVPSHNSPECERVLRDEGVDVLVLSTDAIIRSRILAIPRVATLNAHPGWIPRHRGVGSNLRHLERGEWPAVSVHAVDEGVDTGPLIVRERVEVDASRGLDEVEEHVERRRRHLLGAVIKEAQNGGFRYIDTFCEPSNLVRAMSARQRRQLDELLRSGRLMLS